MPLIVPLVLALAVLSTLPYWLPAFVIRVRTWVLTRINSQKVQPVLELPNSSLGSTQFRAAYRHRGLAGRSEGAALSDLFWYWLSPGAHLHQEHLEPGPQYDALSRVTRRLVSQPKAFIEALTKRCVDKTLERRTRSREVARIEDLMVQVWAEFYYQLVFGEECPNETLPLLCAHATNISTALKCTSLRDMKTRNKLTRLIVDKLRSQRYDHGFPETMGVEDRALFLQGVFFTTGVVQMSGATTHLLLVLAQHPQIQERFAAPDCCRRFSEAVVDESLRLFPLFGIAHRIATEDIVLDEKHEIPKGTVVCFNYSDYHSEFEDARMFKPQRWDELNKSSSNYIPFGVHENRSCPAQRMAWVSMATAAKMVTQRYQLRSSVKHTRSLPSRGPCLFELGRDQRNDGLPKWRRRWTLASMRLADDWHSVYRSLCQLVLGTYMVADARKAQLCERHFQSHRAVSPQPSSAPRSCPMGCPAQSAPAPSAQTDLEGIPA